MNKSAIAATSPGRRALVVTGGSILRTAPPLGRFDVVIAADSGVDSAFAIGLSPDVAVGDLDSISPEGMARVLENETCLRVAPTDKDETDTELALAVARTHDVAHILLLSPGGGRLDHAHGVLTALTHPSLADVSVEAVIGSAHVTVIHGPDSRSIPRRGSHLAALHAMNGTAGRIRTEGLRWNLADENLEPWVSRGVSNEMTGETAHVSVGTGTLLVVQPLAYPPFHSTNP